MMNPTAHIAVYDALADWEAGHLLAELRTGRITGTPFDVVTVAESLDPVTTMGGVRLLPDVMLADLDPPGAAEASPPRPSDSSTPGFPSPPSAARRRVSPGPACSTTARTRAPPPSTSP